MFVKNKVLKNIHFIIVAVITLFICFISCEISFAAETKLFNGKPILREWRVDLKKNIYDLVELENDSELIIRGIIQENKENLIVSDSLGYTKTKVLVTEVFKGDKNLLNQVITYMEPYYEITVDGITGYDVSANYAPAIVNSEYILFLRKYDGDFELYKDTYIIQYYEKGKYLVSNNLKKMRTNISDYVDSLSNEELNIGYNASKVYRNIYKTVIDKYISNTTVSNMENIKPQENTNVSKNEEESAKEIIQSVSLGENQAINKNGNVLIPISTAAELLNCKIDWNAYSKTAFMKRDDIIAEFPINQSYYILNGIQYNTNTQVELYNQRTYISLSIINEIFDTEIVYDSFNNTITLAH